MTDDWRPNTGTPPKLADGATVTIRLRNGSVHMHVPLTGKGVWNWQIRGQIARDVWFPVDIIEWKPE